MLKYLSQTYVLYVLKIKRRSPHVFDHFQNAAEKFQERANVYDAIREKLARAMSYARYVILPFYRQIVICGIMYKMLKAFRKKQNPPEVSQGGLTNPYGSFLFYSPERDCTLQHKNLFKI